MIYTASIYTAPSPMHGIRISVMSRHTLNDGRIPDPNISHESYDYWYRDLAPNPNDLVDFLKKRTTFDEYSERYIAKLRESVNTLAISQLAFFSLTHDITFLCVEQTPDKCHRRLLAEECQRYESRLKVTHL